MEIHSEYYRIIIFDDVMHIKIFSSWDQRVFVEYMNHTSSVISEAYSGKKWCVISDVREWGLSTPGLSERGKRHIFESSCNPNHIAHIVGESELKQWTLEKTYEKESKIENKFFSTVQPSLEWLEGLGYTVPPIHRLNP